MSDMIIKQRSTVADAPASVRLAALLAVAVPAALLTLTSPAQAGFVASGGVSSDAYGASGQFTSGGTSSGFGPIGKASGTGSHGYNKTVSVPSASQVVSLAPAHIPDPTVFATETGIVSNASSGGFGIDFISAQAHTSLKSATMTLMDIPPPPLAVASPIIFPQPFLMLTATGITSSASWSEVFPQRPSVFGAASFSSLRISGSLVGYKTLTFSGNAPKDKVLYNANGVTITLDQQVVNELISCSPLCTATPYGITTDALDIWLHNANIGGHIVSGNFILGQSLADPPVNAPEPSSIALMLSGLAGLGWLQRRRQAARA